MSKNLVIVESPAKAKTIKKYLGSDFEVLASYGHVRDLIPKSGAVDPNNDFAMHYESIDRNKKHLDAIVKSLKNADCLMLATDPDREGEAISWHIIEYLKEKKALKNKPVSRVVFHEITKKSVQEAVANPRDLSMELVNAQQARRALDYLVGFNLSPLLWKKVRPNLSAGRVQSPALRLICEREEEIQAFVSQEYWTVEANLNASGAPFKGKLTLYQNEKVKQFSFTNEQNAQEVHQTLTETFKNKIPVISVEKKQRNRFPAAPFTTSTLQQEASRKLGFSASRTMRTAQRLYEGINIGSEVVGLITYMRTDSVTLAQEALDEIRQYIQSKYGKDYLPKESRIFKTKSKNAQEAHEAVRPTSILRTPEELKNFLESDQYRLYELIWKRTIACQMSPAIMDTMAIELGKANVHQFRATGSTIAFPGFISIYQEGTDDAVIDENEGHILPPLKADDIIDLEAIIPTQHFTEPPPRFSEASLVKTLEEYGIGRPSTYASIISTLQSREYVTIESRRFTPTDIGLIVSKFLSQHFTQYVDYDFTANLEDQLDAVSRGEKAWIPLLQDFWTPFIHLCSDKEQSVSRAEVAQSRDLGTDPKTGKPVSVRMGRFGPFAQIGDKDDEEKPIFASLQKHQRIDTVTLEEALDLFQLPKSLGDYKGEDIEIRSGRFGPYIKHGSMSISIPKDEDPLSIDKERAQVLIEEKILADAPVAFYKGDGVQKAVGRFGPYLKWRDLFVSVNKKYDFDNLTQSDIEELIEAKIQKNIDKVLHDWTDEGIRVEKARWGRSVILQGKTKIELSKEVDAAALTLEEVKEIIAKHAPARKTKAKSSGQRKTTKKTSTKK